MLSLKVPAAAARWARAGVVLAGVLLALGCSMGSATVTFHRTPPPSSAPAGPATSAAGGYSKVLVVMEENTSYRDVIGSEQAPYLNLLARQFGSASAYDPGYPAKCPSLASYLLLTSGSDQGICDDDGPDAHPIAGDSIFQQVARSGREWRVYADSMPLPCTMANAGPYLVRHTAAPYYVSERARCATWDVPLGSLTAGAFHDDVAAGTLPAFSLVAPDACHDMHGGHGCADDHLVGRGDAWLQGWMQEIMKAPDYQAGRLVVVITWDESSSSADNHVATLVISPTTSHVTDATPMTHCATLRTIEDLLRLPALGCAATATPFTARFGLASAG